MAGFSQQFKLYDKKVWLKKSLNVLLTILFLFIDLKGEKIKNLHHPRNLSSAKSAGGKKMNH
ncbi:hypothetical protein IW22_07375 [Chryseobacterium sp. JM1]|nr:hypothetical protein IW22_07375 [Chryseobacterium sp. JM1]